MKKYLKKLWATLIFNFFAVFTALFFSPLEVYLGNVSDFEIYSKSAIIVLLLISTVITLTVTAVECMLPIKLVKMINIVVFALTMCFYLQSMFLNGSLITMTGDKNIIETSVILYNIALWTAIIALVFGVWLILKKYKKEKQFLTAIKFISIAVLLMQAAGFFSLYLSVDNSETMYYREYFSDEGELELSDNKNLIYFIIDYCDADIVKTALAESPDLFEGFDGFTYYPDAAPVHSRTYPSVTYMLTGEKCYFDKPYTQYVNEAFEKSTFISDISELGTDIRLYTPISYIGDAANSMIDNYKIDDSLSIDKIKLIGFLKSTVKISGYRGLPYLVKPIFEYTSSGVNKASLKNPDDYAAINDDIVFYNNLRDKGVTVNENYDSAFRFYHMFGSHPGASIDENAEYSPDEPLHKVLKGDIKIIREYLEQLKELGIYDDTSIIITADHGHVKNNTELVMPVAGGCIMLVKPSQADSSQKLMTSYAPVSHTDLFATAIKSLGGDASKYGESIYEIPENEKRDRYYYYTALYTTTDGEVVLREYLIDGPADELSSYKLTGNNWDVDYSMYAVSNERFSE